MTQSSLSRSHFCSGVGPLRTGNSISREYVYNEYNHHTQRSQNQRSRQRGVSIRARLVAFWENNTHRSAWCPSRNIENRNGLYLRFALVIYQFISYLPTTAFYLILIFSLGNSEKNCPPFLFGSPWLIYFVFRFYLCCPKGSLEIKV